MKLYKIYFFIFLLSFQYAFAQKAPIKLGEVDEKDVKAAQYEAYPDAEAVVLYDYGTVHYDLAGSDIKLVFTHTKRIKILKKTGYEYANINILYQMQGETHERVSDIAGYTHNFENGKVEKVKLEKKTIVDKMVNKNFGEVKFAMPDVKEGSVIEYTYEIRSDFWWYVPAWYFQSTVPTVWSEYRVSSPEYFEFIKISQGYQEFAINENKNSLESINTPTSQNNSTPDALKYENNGNRWVMKNVPPFKDEKFIASPADHIMKMEFQLSATNFPNNVRKAYMESWTKVIKDLMEHEKYGKYIQKKLPEKTLVETLIVGKTAYRDKMTVIYDYVKNNIKYTGRTGIYTKQSLKEVLEKKVGNNAEINLLLVNMLREAGLEAHPVLLSTRPHGKILTQYPIMDKFNYTVVYVNLGANNEEILLDATDPMLPAGMLSYNALNGTGLIVIPDGKHAWANLQLSKFTKTSSLVIATLSMNHAGLIKGELTQRFSGYDAIKKRQKLLKGATTATEEEIEEGEEIDTESEDEDKGKVNQLAFKNIRDFDKPLDGSMQIETSAHSQVNDDFIYLTPLLDYRMKENPFKAETRDFPIDYACATEQSFYMNFTIPEGYKVEEMPKPMRVKWQDESIKYDYILTLAGDKIQLMSKFILTRPIFQAQEYKALRELYAQIVAKQEEQIVLKKK